MHKLLHRFVHDIERLDRMDSENMGLLRLCPLLNKMKISYNGIKIWKLKSLKIWKLENLKHNRRIRNKGSYLEEVPEYTEQWHHPHNPRDTYKSERDSERYT